MTKIAKSGNHCLKGMISKKETGKKTRLSNAKASQVLKGS